MINTYYTTLLPEHHKEMREKRRLTDTIRAKEYGIRSFQPYDITPNSPLYRILRQQAGVRIPAVIHDPIQNKIKIAGRRGLFLPAWTPAGEIIAAQIKPDKYETPEAEEMAKYVWFSVGEDMSEYGTKPHHLMWDCDKGQFQEELPLFYVDGNLDAAKCNIPAVAERGKVQAAANQEDTPATESTPAKNDPDAPHIHVDSQGRRIGTVGIVEGAYKSYLAREHINLTTIGYAGSLDQSKLTLLYYLHLIKFFNDLDEVEVLLLPDAGMQENFSIALIYFTTLHLLTSNGFKVHVAFWNQGEAKNLGDIDELLPEQYSKIRLLSFEQFVDTHCTCVLNQACSSNPALDPIIAPLLEVKPVCTRRHETFFFCALCKFHCTDEHIKIQHFRSREHKRMEETHDQFGSNDPTYCTVCKISLADRDAYEDHLIGRDHLKEVLNNEREEKLRIDDSIFCELCNYSMPLVWYMRHHIYEEFHSKRCECVYQSPLPDPQFYHITDHEDLRQALIQNDTTFEYTLDGNDEKKTIRELHDELQNFSVHSPLEDSTRVYVVRDQDLPTFKALAEEIHLRTQKQDAPTTEGIEDNFTIVHVRRERIVTYKEMVIERKVALLAHSVHPTNIQDMYEEYEMRAFEIQFLKKENASQKFTEFCTTHGTEPRQNLSEISKAVKITIHTCEFILPFFVRGRQHDYRAVGRGINKNNAKRSASINMIKQLMQDGLY